MPTNNQIILIVEDEPSLVFTLRDTLESEGYQVLVAEDGKQVFDTFQHTKPDLMILDVMLPGMSGFEICKKLREQKVLIPVIMLTARDQEIDKVTGLNIGADDYITKPFGVKELLARIHARLRRTDDYDGKRLDFLQLGNVKLDLQKGVAIHPDGDISLSTREVEIIRHLAEYRNEPVSRKSLLENVWRYDQGSESNTRTVDVHISKLRGKLEMDPDDPRHLVTMHGVGYMLKTF